jgi:3-mercaptopyruvate sulfurtransferase SseA
VKKDYPYGSGTVKWVSTDWLSENLKKQEMAILDVQPNIHDYIEEHIPGAVSVPWASLMTDKNKSLLKPDEEILAIFTANNVSPNKTIICTCGTGREATNEFILFKWHFDYPSVKIYEGSFTEWTAYPENPTVTGKNPR